MNCDIVYSQVDLQQQQEVKCIATQGRDTNLQWITNYQIAYSSEGNDWKFYDQSSDEIKVIYCNDLECRLSFTVGVEHKVCIRAWERAVMTSKHLHAKLREEKIKGNLDSRHSFNQC